MMIPATAPNAFCLNTSHNMHSICWNRIDIGIIRRTVNTRPAPSVKMRPGTTATVETISATRRHRLFNLVDSILLLTYKLLQMQSIQSMSVLTTGMHLNDFLTGPRAPAPWTQLRKPTTHPMTKSLFTMAKTINPARTKKITSFTMREVTFFSGFDSGAVKVSCKTTSSNALDFIGTGEFS